MVGEDMSKFAENSTMGTAEIGSPSYEIYLKDYQNLKRTVRQGP